MAITIDYSDPAEYIINIPRADMTLIATVPSEIRQLNIDDLRTELGDLQDDAAGVWAPTAFFHTPPLTISGVTLARVVEILDPYVIQFEDDLYNVNITGGNSNISDKTIKNQVGVNTANSAGLQDPFALQAGAFLGEVAIKADSGLTGTTFPLGTRAFPVNNLADARTIAISRGLATIAVIGDFTFSSGDFSAGFTFKGDNVETTEITIDSGVDVTNCTFQTATIMGTLDGNNIFSHCTVKSVMMFEGIIHECGIIGPIEIGAGTVAQLIGCWSEIAGGGVGAYPMIDMGGAAGTDLLVRDYSGGLGLGNLSNANTTASLDMSSGRVVLDADLTAGSITIRGIAEVTDNSAGATVSDSTLQTITVPDILSGVVDDTGASDITVGISLKALYALAAGNVDRSGLDDRDATFFDQSGLTALIKNRTTDSTRRPFT